MRRILLCTFALAGGFALSCQVFPGGATRGVEAQHRGRLPAVSAPPMILTGDPLAETVARIEGSGAAPSERERAIRRAAGVLEGRHTGLSQREIRRVAETVVDEAAAQEIEVGLVMAVIQVESAGYHRAVSPVGAIGLMQLMPDTGEELARKHGVAWHGEETLFDPIVNVKLGIAYLRQLSDRYDHVPTALAAYNWGPGRIDRRIRRGAKMPQLYVEQVMRAYDDASEAPNAVEGASS